MRHKTSGYFLLSALLVSLILGLCILLNLRCPQAVSDDALTQEQLTRGVTLTGWQQTGPGHWRFAFEAPADVPELVLCLSTRSLDAVPEGLEPTDQRGEAFWVRPVPGRTSEITVTSTTVPQMWLMLPDALWHWRELRSSLQLMALVAFASMGAGILALFCFKPKHELGVFLLYLGVMFGWGLAVLLPARPPPPLRPAGFYPAGPEGHPRPVLPVPACAQRRCAGHGVAVFLPGCRLVHDRHRPAHCRGAGAHRRAPYPGCGRRARPRICLRLCRHVAAVTAPHKNPKLFSNCS
jgi:hypothetical protein